MEQRQIERLDGVLGNLFYCLLQQYLARASLAKTM